MLDQLSRALGMEHEFVVGAVPVHRHWPNRITTEQARRFAAEPPTGVSHSTPDMPATVQSLLTGYLLAPGGVALVLPGAPRLVLCLETLTSLES
jgi:hypothetical protein